MDGVSRVFTISTSFVIVMSTHGDCISNLASIDTFRNLQYRLLLVSHYYVFIRHSEKWRAGRVTIGRTKRIVQLNSELVVHLFDLK